MVLLLKILTDVLLKIVVRSWSASGATAMRESRKGGMIWHSVAVVGSWGKGKLPLCVAVMLELFGMIAWTPFGVGTRLRIGRS